MNAAVNGQKSTLDKPPQGIPRRACLYLLTPAELAIKSAIQEIEKAGGSPGMTEAVNLLDAAFEKVADHIENH